MSRHVSEGREVSGLFDIDPPAEPASKLERASYVFFKIAMAVAQIFLIVAILMALFGCARQPEVLTDATPEGDETISECSTRYRYDLITSYSSGGYDVNRYCTDEPNSNTARDTLLGVWRVAADGKVTRRR